jgi:hypothetical protein
MAAAALLRKPREDCYCLGWRSCDDRSGALIDDDAQARSKPRRGLRTGMTIGIVALVGLGAMAVIAGGRFLSGGPRPAAPMAASPVATSAPPAKVPAPLPPPPATVVVRLRSDPPGAKVTSSRGQVMGRTPLEWTQERAQGELDLRFEKEGYVMTGLSIPLPLYKDLDTTIRLKRRTATAPITPPVKR